MHNMGVIDKYLLCTRPYYNQNPGKVNSARLTAADGVRRHLGKLGE
jgi:hypothetical protein